MVFDFHLLVVVGLGMFGGKFRLVWIGLYIGWLLKRYLRFDISNFSKHK